ncbi:MAG TPA: DUF2459 domain-containing protein [Steroidobacteraceae bacterium]|nr:DUF2459 domain-containing protein [Steroidobacteraceae bacterium]
MRRKWKLRASRASYNRGQRAAIWFCRLAALWLLATVPAWGADAKIYVVRRGWHVDIGFAARDLNAALAPVGARFPGVQYLLFGFGDERYLMAAHHGSPPVLSGALWPGPGLILVTALQATPADAFGSSHVIAIDVSRDELAGAQRFARDAMLGTAPYAAGPYAGSLFYRAAARYSAAHTCNTWATEALAAAGLPVQSRGVVFAGQVWRRAGRLGVSESAGRQH